MKDSDIIKTVCSRCGKEFDVTYGILRRYTDDHKWCCHECCRLNRKESAKKRFSSMSEQELAAWQAKMKDGYNKIPDEKKKKILEEASDRKKREWANKSEEERRAISNSIKQGIGSMSSDAKSEWKKKISNAQKQTWEKLSIEERKEKMADLFAGSKEYWDNITPEELKLNHQLVSEGLKRYFANADPNELKERWKKIGDANLKRWHAMSEYEKHEKLRVLWDGRTSVGPTEVQFANLLRMYGIWYNGKIVHNFYTGDIHYIHPKFFEVFGRTNPINGDMNFPYHHWDFMIVSNNGPDLLIDVDGSVHKASSKSEITSHSGVKFKMRPYMEYQDSKRPYFIPDGYKAYIIQAYNDKLSPETPVQEIGIGISPPPINLNQLINIISLSQFTQKELDRFSIYAYNKK